MEPKNNKDCWPRGTVLSLNPYNRRLQVSWVSNKYMWGKRENSEISENKIKIYFCEKSKSRVFQRHIEGIYNPLQFLKKKSNNIIDNSLQWTAQNLNNCRSWRRGKGLKCSQIQKEIRKQQQKCHSRMNMHYSEWLEEDWKYIKKYYPPIKKIDHK